MVTIGHVIFKEKLRNKRKLLMHSRTTNDEGRRPIAISHLRKKKSKLLIKKTNITRTTMYLLRASTVKKIVRFLQYDILKYLILGTLIRHLVLPVPRFLNQNYPTCTKREGKRHIPVVYVFIVI